MGDLLADTEKPDTFYAVVLADKQEFIRTELTSAGHCTVHTECADALPAHLLESCERALQQATVPSLRADAVLAVMLHTSRTRAAEYIAARISLRCGVWAASGWRPSAAKAARTACLYPFINTERMICPRNAAGRE